MLELINNLNKKQTVSYLLDTCFFIYYFKHDKVHKLKEFCRKNSVGMSSFNLLELNHLHHQFQGHTNHHIRDFLREKLISNVLIDISPGNRKDEERYVKEFDPEILRIIPDASDAVLFTLAIKIPADILTKDSHHIFTAAAENYSHKFRIRVWDVLPLSPETIPHEKCVPKNAY